MASTMVLLAAVFAASGPPRASGGWKRELVGSIGHLRVRVSLEAKAPPSRSLAGSYVYGKKKTALRLGGEIEDGDSFSLMEQDESSKTTGRWEGRVVEDGALYGIWTDPDRTRALPFELHPVTPLPPPTLSAGQAQVERQHKLLTRSETIGRTAFTARSGSSIRR